MFIYALTIMCLWKYDVGIAWQRDYHEIMKKTPVEISLRGFGNHGDSIMVVISSLVLCWHLIYNFVCV